MDKSSIIIITLVVYKLFLIFIGWSSRKKNKTIEDYFVGGKRLGPIITSISYSASNSSAWTLLGVSGIAFSRGISTIWLVIGVIGGMFFSWLKIAPSIHEITKKQNLITIPQLIVDGYNSSDRKNILLASSFIIIFSFTFYIASQFQGAGNALNDTFGLSIVESILLSALVIYTYTYLGGYLAVSITDTIQGFLMAFTAIVMPVMAIINLGGFSELFRRLSMGTAAVILSSGTKGQRAALPHASIVLHQPISGARGQATDIQIRAEEVLKNKKSMLEILSRNTGKTIEELSKDSDRMSYLNPQEALDYGVIDRILTSQKDLPNKI